MLISYLNAAATHYSCPIKRGFDTLFGDNGRGLLLSCLDLIFSLTRPTFQTIVSTSLPTIASDLDASQTQYTWVGVSYMLTQTAFQPLYGKISDLIGRTVSLFLYSVIMHSCFR